MRKATEGKTRISIRLANQFEYSNEESNSCEEDDILHIYSRTSLLVLDYKQYIAARRIQKAWRSYHARKRFANRWKAAICIQRWWRGFWVRLNHLRHIEEQLQQTLLTHYNTAALKIQALYRGWHIRQTVHDMNSLKKMQLCAAEELLTCVAYKLHHLLRTYSIPGVYSLRNSHCLSQVERLLNSMTYRFHNDRVRYIHARQAYQGTTRRKEYNNSEYFTGVPFSAHNNYLCKAHCEQNLFATKDLDRRMHQIIMMYEASQLDSTLKNVKRNVGQRKFRKHVENSLSRTKRRKRNFCADVIESMQRWKIWDKISSGISSDILRTPQNLKSFLDEVSNLMDDICANRHLSN